MDNKVTLSIIIVNYNVKQLLKECLESIETTLNDERHEVIVIDNSSTDDSVKMLRDDFPHVKLIQNSENKGFSAANNQGIAISRGRYLLLLNPDTVVLPQALNTMLEFMDRHSDAGALGCKILNPDGTLQSSCRNFPSVGSIFLENTGLYRLFSKSKWLGNRYLILWDHDEIRSVDSVKGACLMVRREVVDQVGVLDEHFFIYGEEVDWCKRISEAGWKLFFLPDAHIIHHYGKSSRLQAQKNLIEQHKARHLYYQKHFSSLKAFLSRLIAGFGIFLRMVLCLPFFLAKQEKRLEARGRYRMFSSILGWYFGRRKDDQHM